MNQLVGVEELLDALEQHLLEDEEDTVRCPCGRHEWRDRAAFDGAWWCRECATTDELERCARIRRRMQGAM